MSNLSIIYNTILVLRDEEMKPNFTIVPEKTDIYANPYSYSLPSGAWGDPHLYLQVISRGNQRISLGFVSSDVSVFM